MVHLVKVRSDAARNQARILEVARELIGREGPSVSMDAIAAEAGVAVGTLYRHHPTKAALVEAVIGHSISQLAEAGDAANERVLAGGNAGDELAALFRAVVARHSVDEAVKQAAAALGAYAPKPEIGQDPGFAEGSIEQHAWSSIVVLLSAAQREGSIRPDIGPADLLALIAGVPTGSAPDDVRDRYVEIVLAGTRAAGSDRAGSFTVCEAGADLI
jgi:AcrR family transcriptional regulator